MKSNVFDLIAERFKSGNEIPVARAYITRAEYDSIRAQINEEIGQFPPLKAFTRSALIEELQVRDSRVTTHWDGCWKEPQHHACAVGLIERLSAAPPAAPVADGTECPQDRVRELESLAAVRLQCVYDMKEIVEEAHADTKLALARIDELKAAAATDTPASAVADYRALALELEGVLADWNFVRRFDKVSARTVKRVRDALCAAPPPIARSDADEPESYERRAARIGCRCTRPDARCCASDRGEFGGATCMCACHDEPRSDAAPVAQEVSEATLNHVGKAMFGSEWRDIKPLMKNAVRKGTEAVLAIATKPAHTASAAPPFDTRSPCGDPNVTVAARDAVTGEPTMFVRAKGGLL